MGSTEARDFVSVRALLPTLPLPPHAERLAMTTERLLLRPLAPEDLAALHELRTQPEVMSWTATGSIDKDLDFTRGWLEQFLPPNDSSTLNCAICLRETGKLVGVGGCHSYPGHIGWPEVGYLLRREVKGRGLATEFLRGWLKLWAALPRSEEEVSLRRQMAGGLSAGLVEEHLIAITRQDNGASRTILSKCGFEHFLDFEEPDMSDPAETAHLLAYRFFPSKAPLEKAECMTRPGSKKERSEV